MLLACGQSVQGTRNLLFGKEQGIRSLHPFNHLGEYRTAGKRRRASISEKARGFDASITHA